MPVPDVRIRLANAAPVNQAGEHVLYWMTAFRRTAANFALQRAVEHSVQLRKPLVVLEALRAGYPWASDRLHAFVLQGMHDTARRFEGGPVLYHAYVEPRQGDGKGLLEAWAARAALVITDDSPAFFLPRMLASAAARVAVRVEAIDSNGLLPLRATDRAHATAFSFRATLQKQLRAHLGDFPDEDPVARLDPGGPRLAAIPEAIASRWPAVPAQALADPAGWLSTLPIDHGVGVVRDLTGGARAAGRVLRRFLDDRLARYGTDRNQPEVEATSGLSPYLHFGHISVHQVFQALMTREGWTTRKLSPKGGGQREGWWGASAEAESFLDELITWRELAFNTCHQWPDTYDRFESLPAWARASLAKHAGDARARTYTLDAFDAGVTHDPLWNAAQTQLVGEGRMHNYLRMLWGKKILEWSPSPESALETMIELNNRYALDGRDPNSYAGIFWVLGRYDRPWAPERPIFGVIRYMSSENTARKVRVKEYIRRYAPGGLPL